MKLTDSDSKATPNENTSATTTTTTITNVTNDYDNNNNIAKALIKATSAAVTTTTTTTTTKNQNSLDFNNNNNNNKFYFDNKNEYTNPIARIETSIKRENFYLYKRRIIVGRKSKYLTQCDIIIEESNFISRMHFSIELNENIKKFFIYCMSKNGIFVNNKYVQRGVPYILDDHCTLRFPNTTIKLYFESYLMNKNKNDEINGVVNQIQNNNNDECSQINQQQQQIFSEIVNNNDDTNESPIRAHTENSNFDDIFINDDNNFIDDEKSYAAHGGLHKPSYSYAQLITQAIASTNDRQLTLHQIYTFISNKYPYYKINDKGWQNSIRHNLSLNRYFLKVARQTNEPGKGSFWRIDPKCEEKVIEQAYNRKRSRSLTNTNNRASTTNNNGINKNCEKLISEPTSPNSSISVITTNTANNNNNNDSIKNANIFSPPSDSNNSMTNLSSNDMPVNVKIEKILNDSKYSQISSAPASPETASSQILASNASSSDDIRTLPQQQHAQNKLIKLLKNENTIDYNNNNATKTKNETILGYLYQIAAAAAAAPTIQEQKQDEQLRSSFLSQHINNPTYVLQYNLTTLANLIPTTQPQTQTTSTTTTTGDAAQNLTIIPVNELKTENLSPNLNSVKLRHLLNSDNKSTFKRSLSNGGENGEELNFKKSKLNDENHTSNNFAIKKVSGELNENNLNDENSNTNS